MTEAQWLECVDPWALLRYLEGKATARKLRLFCCACCRALWAHLPKPTHAAVEVAERYADGLCKDRERAAARNAGGVQAVAYWARNRNAEFLNSAAACAEAADELARDVVRPGDARAALALHPGQCDLLRDIFGNPFRPLPARRFPGRLVGLARSCYEGDPSLYPLLADALEELGEAQAAAHCREPLHVKGCHVVDWILEKA